jgi:hypothetical protein
MSGKFLAYLLAALALGAATPARAEFLEQYPAQKKYLWEEPKPNLYLGVGLAPVGILKDRAYFGASVFQLHWLAPWVDAEVFSAYFASTRSQADYSQSNHFVFRTIPKLAFNESISAGPLVGWEYVTFPKVQAKLYKDQYFTPSEPFSSEGVIYGFALSENLKIGDRKILKVNQVSYRQTYSVKESPQGWEYWYANEELQKDPEASPIRPTTVFLLEFALLYD